MASPTRHRTRRDPTFIGPVMVVDPETGDETRLEVHPLVRELFELRNAGRMTEVDRRAGTFRGREIRGESGYIYRW